MAFTRSVAALFLAASIGSAAAAPQRIALDDETIFTAVEEALHDSSSLFGSRITVQSRDGFVTLGGSARSVADIAAASRIASRVRGVTGVDNQIRVKPPGWRS